MQCLLSELCMTVWSEQQSTDCMGSAHASAYSVAQTLPRKARLFLWHTPRQKLDLTAVPIIGGQQVGPSRSSANLLLLLCLMVG